MSICACANVNGNGKAAAKDMKVVLSCLMLQTLQKQREVFHEIESDRKLLRRS